MQKERESLEHFEVFEERLESECTEEQLQNAISTKWVKRPKRDGVRCPVCVRGFDQLLRYLQGTKACVLTLRPRVKLREHMTSLDVVTYVDSDWAGCVQTRKSTSGVAVFFNGALIASQSRAQQTIATSSGEAELYSIGLGTSECLFVKSLLLEMEITSKINIRVFTGSSAGTR